MILLEMTIAVSGFNSEEVWLKSIRLIERKVLTLEKFNAACDFKLEKNIVFKNGGQQWIKSS